jgi:hypothetical protein
MLNNYKAAILASVQNSLDAPGDSGPFRKVEYSDEEAEEEEQIRGVCIPGSS